MNAAKTWNTRTYIQYSLRLRSSRFVAGRGSQSLMRSDLEIREISWNPPITLTYRPIARGFTRIAKHGLAAGRRFASPGWVMFKSRIIAGYFPRVFSPRNYNEQVMKIEFQFLYFTRYEHHLFQGAFKFTLNPTNQDRWRRLAGPIATWFSHTSSSMNM
jgi:hypothetical protein